MTRINRRIAKFMKLINRRIAKFMKLYKNPEEAEKVDNYADKQMKELVKQFRMGRKEKKRKKIQNLPMNNLNKSQNKNII